MVLESRGVMLDGSRVKTHCADISSLQLWRSLAVWVDRASAEGSVVALVLSP